MQRIQIPDDHLLPSEQLAMDEALLNAADEGSIGESFRTWQFQQPVVVLGRSSRINDEINHDYCQQHGVSIMRRCSGGASIVAGPGCLMYSIVIQLGSEKHPALRAVDAAHAYVMTRVLRAVRQQVSVAALQGICDLTLDGHKFSGNSLRITRRHLLYHGTLLHAADLKMISECLAIAPRQPDYREGRDHGQFITNVAIDTERIVADLAVEFGARDQVAWCRDSIPAWLRDDVDRLVAQRYGDPAWHRRH